jgi:hypothetical protein
VAKSKVATAADKGAKFLDQARPGWAAEIDPKLLDMEDNGFCILGQLGKGDPYDVLETSQFQYFMKSGRCDDAALMAHGFMVLSDRTQDLANAWRVEIVARTVEKPKKTRKKK